MKGIVFGGGKFGYRNLPKTATTSIMRAIYEIEVGETFCSNTAGMHIHDYMRKKIVDLSACDKRFVVVRDPVKRFISAYKNRVLHHQELSEPFVRKNFQEYYWDIPYFTPGLGQFIDDLDDYLRIRPILRHCRPMVDFLDGKSLEYFTHVYKLENIKRFEENLSEVTGKKVVFGHQQTGGKNYSLRDLSKTQMEKLIDFYKADYELLDGIYAVDELWDEWGGQMHDPEVRRISAKKKQAELLITNLARKLANR